MTRRTTGRIVPLLLAQGDTAMLHRRLSRLLRDDGTRDVHASNACFRLAAIHEAQADYAVAADFYQRGLDCMEGVIVMAINGKGLAQEEAKEHIAQTIRRLRAQAATPP